MIESFFNRFSNKWFLLSNESLIENHCLKLFNNLISLLRAPVNTYPNIQNSNIVKCGQFLTEECGHILWLVCVAHH